MLTKLVLIPSFWGNTPNYFQSWTKDHGAGASAWIWDPLHTWRSFLQRKGLSPEHGIMHPQLPHGLPSEKCPWARWNEAKLLWLLAVRTELHFHFMKAGWTNAFLWIDPMALAMVPFSMARLTALVFHSVSKGYNWNLTQKPFPNTASLGWQQELTIYPPIKVDLFAGH